MRCSLEVVKVQIMNNFKIAALCAMFGSQVGCVSNEAKDSMKPAVLTQPKAELTVERMAQDNPSAMGLNGRMMGDPQVYRFFLKMDASGGCYLIYQKTGQKYPLDGVGCKAL